MKISLLFFELGLLLNCQFVILVSHLWFYLAFIYLFFCVEGLFFFAITFTFCVNCFISFDETDF